jgi:hypothetical protein
MLISGMSAHGSFTPEKENHMFRLLLFALPCLFLLAPFAPAQSVVVPPTITVPQPGLVIVTPTSVDADSVAWLALDSGLQLIPSNLLADSKIAVGMAMQTGSYRLMVVCAKAVSGKAAISQPIIVTVVVGAPGPTPVPPTPVPPTPTDPLAVAVTAAYAQETDPSKAQWVAALAKVYRQGATTAGGSAAMPIGTLYKGMQTYATSLGLAGQLQKVDAAIQAELLKLPIPDPTKNPTLTFDTTTVVNAFNHAASVLESLATSKKTQKERF